MRLKAQRKAIYAAMGLTVLALSGGFAIANFSMGATNTSLQGSQTTTIGSIPGLAWNATDLGVQGPTSFSSCGSSASPCIVTSANKTVCAGTINVANQCTESDFIENITLSTSVGVAFGHTVGVTVYVTVSGTTHVGATVYFNDTAPSHTTFMWLDFDVEAAAGGPAQVTSVSVVAIA
jgi:hypothetical protein